MKTRFAVVFASCLLGPFCGAVLAQEAQQARPTAQPLSHKGKAMRDCHRQMKAGGTYENLSVEQRRKAMSVCLHAQKEEAVKQAELEYRSGVSQR